MTINKKKVLNALIMTVTVSLCAVFVFFFSDNLFSLATEIILESAKAYLPERGLRPDSIKTTEFPTVTLPQTTSEKEATISTTAAKKTTTTKKAVETIAKVPFNHTDDDILSVIKKAEEKAKKDKKDGKISEYTYKNDGVTDKYGLVKVKNVNQKTDINIKSLLEEKADLTANKKEPCVLIFHTHTTETYQILDRDFYAVGHPTRSNDNGINMIRVGEEIVEEIEKAGYKVIHDKTIHDSTYNTAYSHSRKAAEDYLKEFPSIKVALDIHRDAIERSDGTKIKPTATIDKKKAAQIMIISGCQEDGGPIKGFPDWKKNLVFAIQLQSILEELFPGITRPLYFSPRKYNMDLTTCSLLVEVGSDANTLDEAVYTGRCIGKAVSKILEKYEE